MTSRFIRPSDRKESIRLAARTCFISKGYTATSIADIRKESGATTGSIYHFYENKAALAEELLADALNGWLAAVRHVSEDPKPADGFRSAVAGLVRWGMNEPHEFMLLQELSVLASRLPELSRCAMLVNGRLTRAAAAYEQAVADGDMKAMPLSVALALMLGPSLEFLRSVATDRLVAEIDVEEAAETFANAAWMAVRNPDLPA